MSLYVKEQQGTACRKVFIAAARRTAVVPRNGAFAKIEAAELAAAVIQRLLVDAGLAAGQVNQFIMGNALYGGGNPARVAGLAAGLPPYVPALTIDSQCCAGLDAIGLGAAQLASGQADIIIAGGLESYSRSPLRMRRPREPGETPLAYSRPPFTPWPDNDPEMMEAAAALAQELKISRHVQEAFAISSHRKAIAHVAGMSDKEIVAINGVTADTFSRSLNEAICARLPVLAGDTMYGVTPATTAVEADAAAAVLLVSENALVQLKSDFRLVECIGFCSAGGDPARPGIVPIEAASKLLRKFGILPGGLAVVEIMEAFAVQALAFTNALAIPTDRLNRGGGALARGHPIGASGAILAVRMFHEMQTCLTGDFGLAAIAAAGGLGSAALVQV